MKKESKNKEARQVSLSIPYSSLKLDDLRSDLALGAKKNWDHLWGSPSFTTYQAFNAMQLTAELRLRRVEAHLTFLTYLKSPMI